MIQLNFNKEIFQFHYLPDYARFLLEKNLNEFSTVGIRFCREADLPLLKPLSKYSEKELVALTIDSNRKTLEALKKNKIADHIEDNTRNWIANTLGIIDKDDVVAEDLTLVFYVRRRLFAHFLDAYTKNVYVQKFIIAELDMYTTQEELILYNVYLKMQREKMDEVTSELLLHKELLLEAQELSGIGAFLINFQDESKSFLTPECKKIFTLNEWVTFEQFIQWVHPDDQPTLKALKKVTDKEGGKYEVVYNYKKGASKKRIWSKGFAISRQGKPLFIRGIVKEIN